jgi:hypothetical protein
MVREMGMRPMAGRLGKMVSWARRRHGDGVAAARAGAGQQGHRRRRYEDGVLRLLRAAGVQDGGVVGGAGTSSMARAWRRRWRGVTCARSAGAGCRLGKMAS